jgi:hypothetical protein
MAPASPLVGKELPVERHDNAVTGRVGHPADIEPEVDGAHDAITELFVVLAVHAVVFLR